MLTHGVCAFAKVQIAVSQMMIILPLSCSTYRVPRVWSPQQANVAKAPGFTLLYPGAFSFFIQLFGCGIFSCTTLGNMK